MTSHPILLAVICKLEKPTTGNTVPILRLHFFCLPCAFHHFMSFSILILTQSASSVCFSASVSPVSVCLRPRLPEARINSDTDSGLLIPRRRRQFITRRVRQELLELEEIPGQTESAPLGVNLTATRRLRQIAGRNRRERKIEKDTQPKYEVHLESRWREQRPKHVACSSPALHPILFVPLPPHCLGILFYRKSIRACGHLPPLCRTPGRQSDPVHSHHPPCTTTIRHRQPGQRRLLIRLSCSNWTLHPAPTLPHPPQLPLHQTPSMWQPVRMDAPLHPPRLPDPRPQSPTRKSVGISHAACVASARCAASPTSLVRTSGRPICVSSTDKVSLTKTKLIPGIFHKILREI